MPHNKHNPQPFGVDGMNTTLDKMKARFQYNDEEIKDLTEEYKTTLTDASHDLPWTPRPEPTGESRTPAAIQEYYVEARRDLSIQTIKRALLLNTRLQGLEDELLGILERMLLGYSKLRTEHIRTADLGRVQRMLESIKSSNSMFQEATEVPAGLDPDKAPEEMESDKKWVLEIIKAVKDDNDKESANERPR